MHWTVDVPSRLQIIDIWDDKSIEKPGKPYNY